MNKKTILITGSTDGIGEQTAGELARRGHRVLLHGRNEKKGKSVMEAIRKDSENDSLIFYLADFADLAAVRKMAETIKENEAGLDVLINNAANYYKERRLNGAGLEMTFTVNHLASFVLTLHLLPFLKKNAPARIVNVASSAHKNIREVDFSNLQGEQSYDGFHAYSLSKLGNVLFTQELSRRLEGSGVTVNSLDPGVVDTKLLHKSFGGGGKSVEEGAQTSIYLADSPQVADVTGKYFKYEEERQPSDLAMDEDLQKKFWEASEVLAAEYLG